MVAQPTRPILIIGAGISGLATGRILTNNGIPNIVFEASPPDRDQGFSISLREWGYSTLLEGLGGLPLSSLTKGVAPDRHIGGSGWIDQALRDNRTGEMLVAPDPATKQSIVRANRNALRTWMADCGEDELDVRYGHKLKSFWGEVGNITVEFVNGAQYQGSLLVAADGVHSTGMYTEDFTMQVLLPVKLTLLCSAVAGTSTHRARNCSRGGLSWRISAYTSRLRSSHQAPQWGLEHPRRRW